MVLQLLRACKTFLIYFKCDSELITNVFRSIPVPLTSAVDANEAELSHIEE